MALATDAQKRAMKEYYLRHVKGKSQCTDCGLPIRLGSKVCSACLGIRHTGERSKLWKGDNLTKGNLHRWIKKHKPKPKLCVRCNKRPAMDLANISQTYKRNITDYEWLCRYCHMDDDGRLKRIKELGTKALLKYDKTRNHTIWKCEICGKKTSPRYIRCWHCCRIKPKTIQ